MSEKMYNFPSHIVNLLPENFFTKAKKFEELLLQWNQKMNLISSSTEDEISTRHILDSVQLIPYIDKNSILVDIGSGAGFPGLILSYAGVKKVFLIESNKKKSSFLSEASLISDEHVEIINERCENIKNIKADIITARAVATIDNILKWSKNLRKNNTQYLLLKGKNVDIEIEGAKMKWECSTWNIPSITNNESKIILIKDIVKKAK